MRFKDYIVNTAIKVNYDNIVKGNDVKESTIQKVFTNASNKLGYKIIDETSKQKSYPCENSEWKQYISRYAYGDKRFLIYDRNAKKSIYFSESGVLFYGVNGKTFTMVSPLENFEAYGKYKDFLTFVKTYFKNIKTEVKQYILIGFDNLKMYYLCTDGNCYYKQSNIDDYIICDERDNKKTSKYLLDLG